MWGGYVCFTVTMKQERTLWVCDLGQRFWLQEWRNTELRVYAT